MYVNFLQKLYTIILAKERGFFSHHFLNYSVLLQVTYIRVKVNSFSNIFANSRPTDVVYFLIHYAMIRSQRYSTSPLALALAGAIGAALGLMFAPKSGEEMREDITHRAQDLAVKFKKSKEDVQQSIMKIFGQVSDELEKDYVQLRANVMAEIDELKDKKDLTKDRYSELVSRAIKSYSKGKEWTKESMQDLRKHFEDEWSDIKESVQ